MSKRIESEKVTINSSPEKIFNFIGNFDNFSALLPEKVENWQSTGDSCSFEVKGLATLGLRITERVPFTKVTMTGEGKLPFDFTLAAIMHETSLQQSEVQLIVDSDMSQFIAMMAANPLKDFINALVNKLKIEMEK
jgi:carbon monoxide dehydrogenase subunit G